MRHVFRATRIGWERKQDGIWFDADTYTIEEARAEFKPYEGITERGYPYTGYEYDGIKYHDVAYLGEYEEDDMPQNDSDYYKRLWSKNR